MKTTLLSRSAVAYALCVSLGLLSGSLQAQAPVKPASGLSPNAATLVNAHSSAVAPYTGALTLSIPLYRLQERQVDIPISLNYAATGFKPDEQPGWVGMGWSLEAGGVITRSVQDLPDELTMDSPPLQVPTGLVPRVAGKSSLYKAGLFWMNDWQSLWDNARAGTTPQALLTLAEANDERVANWPNPRGPQEPTASPAIEGLTNVLDTEPDIFTFSFPGGSGKFYLNAKARALGVLAINPCTTLPSNSAQWSVECSRPVKVELITYPSNLPSTEILAPTPFDPISYLLPELKNRSADLYNPRTFFGFIVTADDGVKYTYGASLDASTHPSIEYSKARFTQNSDYWTAVAWHLTRIEYPNEQVVYLNYGVGANNYPAETPAPTGGMWAFTEQLGYSGRTDYFLGTNTTTDPYAIKDNPWDNVDGSIVRPLYLKQIRVAESNTRIEFNREQRAGMPCKPELYPGAQQRICGSPIPCNKFTRDAPVGNGVPGIRYAQLNSITVETEVELATRVVENRIVKRFEFTYSQAPPPPATAGRLQLLTVTEKKPDGSDGLKPYTFSYYANPAGGDLPMAFTGDVDHWGYFNNMTVRKGGALNWNNNIFYDREPLEISPTNLELARMGMMREMVSPLGEKTEFEFEQQYYGAIYDRLSDPTNPIPGRVSNLPGTPMLTLPCVTTGVNLFDKQGVAGGVRLKRIRRTSLSGTASAAQSVSYTYDQPRCAGGLSRSTGILTGEVMYSFTHYNCAVARYLATGPVPVYETGFNSVQSLLPALNGAGAHIGYTTITEHYDDGSTKESWYGNYDYAFNSLHGTKDGYPTQTLGDLTPHGPYRIYNELRGKLAMEKWFSAPVSGSAELVRQRTLTYDYAPLPSNSPVTSGKDVGVESIRISTHQFRGANANDMYWIAEASVYQMPTLSTYLSQEVTTTYEHGQPQDKKRIISYNTKGLVSQELEVSHDPTQTRATEYTYVCDDLTGLFTNSTVNWVKQLYCKNMWNYPLEVINRVNGKVVGGNRSEYNYAVGIRTQSIKLLVDSTLTQYAKWTPNQVLYNDVWNPAPNSGVFPYRFRSEEFVTLGMGVNGRSYKQTLSTRAAGMHNGTIWGYDDWLPIATITNIKNTLSTATQCAVEDFESGVMPFWYSSNGTMPGANIPSISINRTGWNWVASLGAPATAGETYVSPVLTEKSHTGRFALRPPGLVEPVVSSSQRPQSNNPIPSVSNRPNKVPCSPPGGNNPPPPGPGVPPTADIDLIAALKRSVDNLQDPFWCLQAELGFGVSNDEDYTLSFWARRNEKDMDPDVGPLDEGSGFVAAWFAPCRMDPVVALVPMDRKWRFYSFNFSKTDNAEDAKVLLGGNLVILDDIRLTPRDSRVTTYTHKPHVGVTSIIDENNQTVYYEYDDYGRLRAVFDADGNLLQGNQYELSRP
jgi:YD repeat-containing protein